MRLFRKVRTAFSLDANARWLIAAAAIIPIAARSGFRLIGVARTQKYLRRCVSRKNVRRWSGNPDELINKARSAQRVVKRNTHIEGTCLVRSLTLWTMLLRFGLAADLRLGMRSREGRMEGHAWLEYQGVPINEDSDLIRTYQVYPRPISFDAWMAKEK